MAPLAKALLVVIFLQGVFPTIVHLGSTVSCQLQDETALDVDSYDGLHILEEKMLAVPS
jgi:hypothetical protein